MRIATAVLLSVLLVGCNGGGGNFGNNPPPGGGPPVAIRTETVVASAAFPVTAAFAPDGRLFYTEKAGAVRVVMNPTSASPQLLATPFVTFPNLATNGEQGLLGLTFDPSFALNRFVYIYYTESSPTLRNRVVRYTDMNSIGSSEFVVVDNLPVNSNHNGGRLAFGPPGFLYLTVGDAGTPAHAQSPSSPARQTLPN